MQDGKGSPPGWDARTSAWLPPCPAPWRSSRLKQSSPFPLVCCDRSWLGCWQAGSGCAQPQAVAEAASRCPTCAALAAASASRSRALATWSGPPCRTACAICLPILPNSLALAASALPLRVAILAERLHQEIPHHTQVELAGGAGAAVEACRLGCCEYAAMQQVAAAECRDHAGWRCLPPLGHVPTTTRASAAELHEL